MRQFEYRVIDTGRDIERQLNELGGQGWRVVGVNDEEAALHRAASGDHPDA